MATVTLDVNAWAEEQFSDCDLRDRRRTQRLVKFAAQSAEKPEASTPNQTETWGDLKAAYRLFDQPDVTFTAITTPHRMLTRDQMREGVWLILNDTTELNFGYLREIEGVGRVGSDNNRGFFLHTALAVRAADGDLAGVAAHELFARPLKKQKRVSSRVRKQKSQRETDVWLRVIEQAGRPAAGARHVHVCDRGADNYDVYCQLMMLDSGWVIRAAQLKRQVIDQQGETVSLDALISGASCLGTYELTVNANGDQPARTAHMEVRAAWLEMPPPRTGMSRFAKKSGFTKIPMWAVEVREVSSVPAGTTPLRWVLLTSEEATSFAACWRVVEYYERRPLIEEYHKCLKTGCSVESRQYQTGARLAGVIGLTTVMAIRLLQLKQLTRTEPNRPAREVVPARWITVLRQVLRRPRPLDTVREFFRALASLGGFLCRKCDGEPGWQTIWRGLEKLLQCLRGIDAARQKCG